MVYNGRKLTKSNNQPMKFINIEVLKPGDIVLTTSNKKVSALIRAVTKSDISHAMICVAYGSVMDSTIDGVQARNVQKILYDDNNSIYILRTKEPLPTDKLEKIITYARASTGTSYSGRDAATVVKRKKTGSVSAKQFCSRMVARAYASAGIALVANPDFCAPEELKKSDILMIIEPSWLKVSADEEGIELEDTTERMREVTNDFLTKVRTLDKKIESLNDVDKLLIERQELDSQISKALISSGYLEHWKIEQLRFPWRYDPMQMVQFYHSLTDKGPLFEYCRDTLRDHEVGTFVHWEANAKGYSQMNKAYPRKSFQLLEKLYLTLNFNHYRRVKSAKILLRVYET
tara:strand:- start:268 stop:1305 length:1038 start_codon:yes stop_codon:yes gene_type:complete